MRYSREKQIRYARRRGFSLIEILVVVVLLGILAAVVIPQFRDSSDQAARVTFMTSGRIFAQAAER